MKKSVIILLALLLWAYAGFAQVFAIKGHVLNDNGKAVPNYPVNIKGDSIYFMYNNMVKTDADGFYSDTIKYPFVNISKLTFIVSTYDCKGQLFQKTVTYNNNGDLIADFTICDSVFPPPPPSNCKADFNYYPDSNSTGLVYDFLPLQVFYPVSIKPSWSWNFGDGTTSKEENPVHEFPNAGEYNVCLTLSVSGWDNDTIACTDTYCADVWVQSPPPPQNNCSAYFYFTPDSTALTYSFYDQSQGDNIIGWSWNFGDSTKSTDQNLVHQFAQAGEYNVCLTTTATADNGQVVCTDTYCQIITVGNNPPPPPSYCKAYFDYYPDSTGFVYNFNDLSEVNNITNWLWNFGDSTKSTDQNPVHQFAQAGEYNVCLTIIATADNGQVACTDSYCQEIYVGNNPPPPFYCKAYFDYYPDSTGFVYNFNDLSEVNNITNRLWNFGDSTKSTDQNPVHQFVQAGTYNVCLTISSIGGGSVACTDTYCQIITVGNNPPPPSNCKADFNYYPDSNSTGLVYDFLPLQVFYPVSIKPSWSWDFGDGTTSKEENPVHEFPNAGEYNVCLTLSVSGWDNDTIACTDTYCADVWVQSPPPPQNNCSAYFYFTPDSIAITYSFYDQSQGDNITGWSWNFGDSTKSTEQNPVHQFAQAGTYNVCLTISSIAVGSVACTDTYCQEIYAGNNPPPPLSYCKAYFDYYPDSAVFIYIFNDLSESNNITNRLWNFGDSTKSTDQNPVHQFAQAGAYKVCLTITAIADNGQVACTDTYCQIIYVGNNPSQNCSANFDIYPTFVPHVYNIVNMAWGVKPIKYLWSWGDGTYDTTAYPSHTYDSTGFYKICLTITDSVGCKNTFCISASLLKSNNSIIRIDVIPYGNTSGINEKYSDKSLRLSQNIPNPASNSTLINYELQGANNINLVVTDVTGREIMNINKGKQKAGYYSITLNTASFANGMYYYTLNADNTKLTRKMIINK